MKIHQTNNFIQMSQLKYELLYLIIEYVNECEYVFAYDRILKMNA